MKTIPLRPSLLSAALLLLGLGGVAATAPPAAAADQVLYSLGLHSNEFRTGTITAGAVRDADGNVYGVAQLDQGNNQRGALYRISPDGTYTNLHLFGVIGSDGYGPAGTPLLSSDGNLYGTTVTSDTQCGSVYRYNLDTGAYSVLYIFPSTRASGCRPQSGVIEGADGSLWGTTTSGGGGQGQGTVFHVNRDGTGFTVVNRLGQTQSSSLGVIPVAPLTLGSDGNYYGTTTATNNAGNGTVFRVTPAGVLTRLGTFTGSGADGNGSSPVAALIETAPGVFYGTAQSLGPSGGGTIFRVVATADSGTLSRVYTFDGTEGFIPSGGLTPVQDGSGALLGTTRYGGFGYGTVYRFDPVSNTVTTITEFENSTGTGPSEPLATLTRGADNNFYGTSSSGGSALSGNVFRITPGGVVTNLLSLATAPEGSGLQTSPVQAGDGNLYGFTPNGGARQLGTLYRLTPDGAYSSLLDFNDSSYSAVSDGLLLGSDGDLYGAGDSRLFKVSLAGFFTELHRFTGSASEGSNAYGGLIQGSDGNYYGTNTTGGPTNLGGFFQITPDGRYTFLASFNNARGNNSQGRLAQGSDGNFYGTTSSGGQFGCGTVFRATVAPAAITAIHSFNCDSEGAGSYAGLTLAPDGNFYGLGLNNGSSRGTAFRISQSGAFTVIYTFDPATGFVPTFGRLAVARDGNFYGTTSGGGASSVGVLFRLTPQGDYRVLHTLTGARNDGSNFRAQPIQASDGALYATTFIGGAFNRGAFIRVAGPADIVQNLTATAAYGQVTLNWDASPRAVSYNIYQGSTAGAENPVPIQTGVTGTSAVISGLGNNNVYYFTMTAVNAVGETQPSVEVFASIDGTPDPVLFTDVSDAPSHVKVFSESLTVTGLDVPVPVTISGSGSPLYSINGNTVFQNTPGTLRNGDTIQVRVDSATAALESVSATLAIGASSTTWTVTTGFDTTPDPFSFGTVTNLKPRTTYTSETRIITGINTPSTVQSLLGTGTPFVEYRINDGAFTTVPGATVQAGDSVQLRLTTGERDTTALVSLDIGGTAGTLTASTKATDATPKAYSFKARTDVARATVITSNAVLIDGINTPLPISITGPGAMYSIDGGEFTSAPRQIRHDQVVRVRLTSAAEFNTAATATLTIGSVTADFTATTQPADATPDAFTFTSVTGATAGRPVNSDTVRITGINTPVAVSIAGGNARYSINGGPFTAAAGMISNRDNLRLRLTAPAAGLSVTATINVGGVTADWSVSSAP